MRKKEREKREIEKRECMDRECENPREKKRGRDRKETHIHQFS